MNNDFELMLAQKEARDKPLTLHDPGANPFKLTVDPAMRLRLKKALFELIDNHDTALEQYVSDGRLQLSSYKEYIELFARALRETMDTREGVSYLLQSCGFDVPEDHVNLHPDWRWKDSPQG